MIIHLTVMTMAGVYLTLVAHRKATMLHRPGFDIEGWRRKHERFLRWGAPLLAIGSFALLLAELLSY